jgi:hypothetical protein
MCAMNSLRASALPTILSFVFLLLPAAVRAQNSTGAVEFVARIAPTGGRPEPVRQFTFYLLTKSYAGIIREVEVSAPAPNREQYIATLDVSQPLKDWLKKTGRLDLTSPDLETLLTAEEITSIPEFLNAYVTANSGGATPGLPQPKYEEGASKESAEKYERLRQQYLQSLRKFINMHRQTLSGMEAELDEINPQRGWLRLQEEYRRKVERLAPGLAQTRYLAAKVDTDLDGRAALANIPAGSYWLSTLNLDAAAGDVRLRWDVPVTVRPGETVRLELSDLNAADSSGAR